MNSEVTNRQGKRAGRATFFSKFARTSTRLTGHPYAFGIAFGLIVVWGITGPIFGFSDTWQLVINTATTIITFLMVFLLQNAQNRDGEAIQLKLAELIRATESAHNAFLDIEEISEHELEQIKLKFEQLAQDARENLRTGKTDLGCPEAVGNRRQTQALRRNSSHDSQEDLISAGLTQHQRKVNYE
jgi:low affinity Fe/Cu permease